MWLQKLRVTSEMRNALALFATKVAELNKGEGLGKAG
jgi:hypothetical protein